ncbi:Retrotransposon gag protein [Rhizoctonia solani]|uniref:Retrotransposon gag protein n=1 Tax=Rhizoctonia solani TaxID=456999 RepID=A0A8H7I205_9AGAM|nr:Retrotransposon gag protein [Rhizoctonia solani]
MATRSRTASQAQSPFDQGYMEPALPSTTSVKYGEVSLEQVTRLLLGLLGQVKHLEQEIAKIKEAELRPGQTSRTSPKLLMLSRMGSGPSIPWPRTPKGPQAKAVEETPRPLPKTKPIGLASGVPFWSEAPKVLPGLAQPTPRRVAPPQVPSPPTSLRGSILPPDEHEGLRRAWAHPHLDQLGSHRAIIRTVEDFKLEFLAAFGDPDATRAAEQKITTLTQSGTCADYITKFRTLAMELDWNDAALQGQFARGLHWEVSRQIATHKHRPRTLLELQNAALVIDNALCEERASHPPKDSKSSRPTNPARGTSTGQSSTGSKKLSNNPNFVLEEEQNCRRAAGACIKCGKMGHKFAECRTGWKATPIKDKGKAKETAKVGEDSKYQLGKE